MNAKKILGLAALFSALLLAAGCRSGTTNPPPVGPAPTTFDITLSKAGTGAGSVSSSPVGINCNAACPGGSLTPPVDKATFTVGTVVTLTATPSPGQTFAGWTVAGLPNTCTGTGTCQITANSGVTVAVTARFDLQGAAEEFVALTASKRIVSFKRDTPESLSTNTPLIGLDADESLIALDYRPLAGGANIYGLSDKGNLYLVNPATGILSDKVALTAAAGDDNAFTTLDPTASYGMDFNTVADRLRIVSSKGDNWRVQIRAADNTVTPAVTAAALVTTDAPLNGGATKATAAAYTNSYPGAKGTVLFVIGTDGANDTLYIQNPPNSGTLTAVGALGVDASDVSGFDIRNENREAFAVLNDTAGKSTLYSINLTSGAATRINSVAQGAGETLRALTVLPTSPPLSTGDVFALSSASAGQQLISFNRAAPNTIRTRSLVLGLEQSTERLVGIDFRPSDGLLYGVSSAARLYTINLESALTSKVANLVAADTTEDATAPFTGLSGTEFGLDFNPVADSDRAANPASLRLISSSGQNLRIRVQAGTAPQAAGQVLTDTDLNRGAGPPVVAANATAAAYTNNFQDAGTTELLVIDTANDMLAAQTTAAGATQGLLTNRGALGLNAESINGFDIDGISGSALAALKVGSANNLYLINLSTGAASAPTISSGDTLIGGGSEDIRGLALRPVQRPIVYGLTTDNKLLSFYAGDAATLLTGPTAITGLVGAEQLIGIDFRPQDNQLYGITDARKIYKINHLTAVASNGVLMTSSPNDTSSPFFTNSLGGGASIGVDFDPTRAITSAQLKLINSDKTHLNTNPDTGETFGEASIVALNTSAPIPPPPQCAPSTGGGAITGTAFTNSVAGAGNATLLGIDQVNRCLYTINPTSGALATVGALFTGMIASGEMGFDIGGGTNGLSLAALDISPEARSTLHRINLTSGAATAAGAIGPVGTLKLRGLAVLFPPTP